MQDGPVGRQRIGGGAGGRGHDQAVGPLAVHEHAIDPGLQLDHAGARGPVDDDIIHGQRAPDLAAIAHHPCDQHGAVFRGVAAIEDGAERCGPLVERDVGDEAQAAVVDAHQRHLGARKLSGQAEQGAVAAHRDGQIGLAADAIGIGGLELGSADGLEGVGLHQHPDAAAGEKACDLEKRRRHPFRLIAAHQRDGSECLGHAGD